MALGGHDIGRFEKRPQLEAEMLQLFRAVRNSYLKVISNDLLSEYDRR
jgi:hypothetical protein